MALKTRFMVHKHHATRLHYDLRIEIEGSLKSWAMYGIPIKANKPNGATKVSDHQLWYRHFEGVIPEGKYGAGPVMIWDKGIVINCTLDASGKPITLSQSLKEGCLVLHFEGQKLRGKYVLVRTSKTAKWLFLKLQDKHIKKGRLPKNWARSVKSNRTIEQLKFAPKRQRSL